MPQNLRCGGQPAWTPPDCGAVAVRLLPAHGRPRARAHPDGAMGVVLGRAPRRGWPTPSALAELPGADDLVYLGGPVSPQSVVALGDFGRPEEAGTQVVGSLGTLDPEAPNESLRRVRVYAGYAGWAPRPARRRARAGRVDRSRRGSRGPVPLGRHLGRCARTQGRPLSPDGDDAGGPVAELADRQAARDRRPVRIQAAAAASHGRPRSGARLRRTRAARSRWRGSGSRRRSARRLRSCRRRSARPRGRAAPAARRCPAARAGRRRARSAPAGGSPA